MEDEAPDRTPRDDTRQATHRHGAVNRRTVLGALATAGTAALAGCSMLGGDTPTETNTVSEERARDLAERFAPTLYFDQAERWFPTDPRPYTAERDGQTVVDGFAAFNDYTAEFRDSGDPPNPTVFYNVVEYANSPLAVVQFWLYSAFDQFSTNFHWHDWEVVHVFVDTDTGDPQLFVASAHARKIPNNEFLDPESGTVPHVLTELGSHSSALSVNQDRDNFQRLPVGDLLADITNSPLEGLDVLAQLPMAYGLPRGEGFRLPFVRPELDGNPIHEHAKLPDVSRDDLLPDALTIQSFDALSSPPGDLPKRSTGTVFAPATGDAPPSDAVTYDLAPTSELEHIAEFTGPQLSFEFAIPQFAEDAIASHLTTTPPPWTQPRYEDPAADITDGNHRRALADRYDVIGTPGTVNSVLAAISDVTTNPDAPSGAGITTDSPTVEGIALLESDPTPVPTFNGVAVAQDVPSGDHRLTVNRAGTAPHSETVSVPDDQSDTTSTPVAAGVDGQIPLVARKHATKLGVDPSGTDAALTDLAIEDDFGGRIYDAPLDGPDAVYVHRAGAYTTEVRDSDGAFGAFRTNPASDADGLSIDDPDTGKASLATFLADIADETRTDIEELGDSDDDDRNGGGGGTPSSNAVKGLTQALAAVAEAARRAAERAQAGNRGRANDSLETVTNRLDTVSSRLADAQGDLPDEWTRATQQRLEQANRRSQQARDIEKL